MESTETGLNFGFGFSKVEKIETEKEEKVMVLGQPYMSWVKSDTVAAKVAIVQLYELGLAKQEELAEIFQLHVNSIYNYITTYKECGIEGLIRGSSGPKEAWKITGEIRSKILMMVLREGVKKYGDIRQILEKRWNKKVSIESIRQVLVENGFVEERIKTEGIRQEELFRDDRSDQFEIEFKFEEAVKEEQGNSKDGVEVSRADKVEEQEQRDQLYSGYSKAERRYLDGLEQGQYSAYGGGLLFVPLLEGYRFLPMIRDTINLETYEGYSLEQLCLTLFYFDLFGFHSIEDFKTVYPEEFGMLIGKLKNPSIFTLRRFLHKVRELGIGERITEEFAKGYLSMGLAKYGVLYIDGHFLPYYGMREITMGWNTIREKAMSGSYGFIGNDEAFNPLIFLVRPSSEDLLEKIPEMVNKIKKIGREAGIETNDLTVIFDREGYSAELFRTLDDLEEEKVKFITWAKYSDRWVNDFGEEKFEKKIEVRYEIAEKEDIWYFEIEREMNKYGKIRAIVIESGDNKKRSVIYSNDLETDAGKIIELICRRWGQENLIKTLKLRHLMDYHPGYVSEELEEQPMVKNPEWTQLKQERANLLSQLHKLELKFAEKVLNEVKEETVWKEIQQSEIDTLGDIAVIKSQITLINQEIDRLPKEVKFNEAHADRNLCELDYEKKRFLDCIKVFVCHMEKKMCGILLRYYDLKKELWPALSMIVNRGTYVKLKGGKLLVQLKRFRNPDIDYAARHLCEELNRMKPKTPDKFGFSMYFEVQ